MKISTSQSPVPEDPKDSAVQPAENRQRPLPYEDDLVARVRAARAEAQRQMEEFGDVSEYEIRKIYGQRTDIKYGKEGENAQEQTTDLQAGKTPGNEEA